MFSFTGPLEGMLNTQEAEDVKGIMIFFIETGLSDIGMQDFHTRVTLQWVQVLDVGKRQILKITPSGILRTNALFH